MDQNLKLMISKDPLQQHCTTLHKHQPAEARAQSQHQQHKKFKYQNRNIINKENALESCEELNASDSKRLVGKRKVAVCQDGWWARVSQAAGQSENEQFGEGE